MKDAIIEILVAIYFVGNGYLTGLSDADTKTKWWRTLLMFWFAIPVFIGLGIWWGLNEGLKDKGWFIDLKFWFQLNFTGYWNGLTKEQVNTYERAITSWEEHSASRVVKQWLRIKKKYSY